MSVWLGREPNRVTTTRQNERDVALDISFAVFPQFWETTQGQAPRPYQLCEDHGNPFPLIFMEDTAVDAFLTSSFGTFVMALWHGVLSAPSWQNFTSLAYGWAIASGRQTITTYLWGSGAAQVKHFSRYYVFW